MDYKEVIEAHIGLLKDIITELCEARDKYGKKTASEAFFQAQIEAIASLKNRLEQDFMNAQISEAKK